MGSLEADLAAAEREGRKAWAAQEHLAQQLANERFGYKLPQLHTFVEAGVRYELNVYARLRKVGLEYDD